MLSFDFTSGAKIVTPKVEKKEISWNVEKIQESSIIIDELNSEENKEIQKPKLAQVENKKVPKIPIVKQLNDGKSQV